MSLTYVTGNHGKYLSVKEKFARHNIPVEFYKYDCIEPEINDIKIISKVKATAAYEILKSPCFVSDSGFYINSYPNRPGYPGAFAKRSGISENPDYLLATMQNVTDRSAFFLDCVTFYDGDNYYTFYGKSPGTIAPEKRGTNIAKAKSALWYVFIPKNHDKTLAEMTDFERANRNDGATSAYEEFINWYENVYTKPYQKTKK